MAYVRASARRSLVGGKPASGTPFIVLSNYGAYRIRLAFGEPDPQHGASMLAPHKPAWNL